MFDHSSCQHVLSKRIQYVRSQSFSKVHPCSHTVRREHEEKPSGREAFIAIQPVYDRVENRCGNLTCFQHQHSRQPENFELERIWSPNKKRKLENSVNDMLISQNNNSKT